MKTQRKLTTVMIAFAMMVGASTFAQSNVKIVQVGGSPMYPSKNIIENAVNSKDHTTLVAAVWLKHFKEKDHSPFLHPLTQHLRNYQKEQLNPYLNRKILKPNKQF